MLTNEAQAVFVLNLRQKAQTPMEQYLRNCKQDHQCKHMRSRKSLHRLSMSYFRLSPAMKGKTRQIK